MAYTIITDETTRAEIAALPPAALAAFREVLKVLETVPWNGEPSSRRAPDGNLRMWPFDSGLGLVSYLILEDQDRVDIVRVTWLG